MFPCKYYCELCGFLSRNGKEKGYPIGYCPVCNKPLKTINVIDRIKMSNYTTSKAESYIQDCVLHKKIDPIYKEKRDDFYQKRSKIAEAEIEKILKEARDRSYNSYKDYFKNFDQAKQNGATDEVAAKAHLTL